MHAQIVPKKATLRTDKLYTYLVPNEMANKIQIGSQVLIPFGKRMQIGYVVELGGGELPDIKNIKEIIEIRGSRQYFTNENVQFAKWISFYYVSLFTTALRLFMPPDIERYEKLSARNRLEIEENNVSLADRSEFGLDESIAAQNERLFEKIKTSIDKNEFSEALIKGSKYKDVLDIYIQFIKIAIKKDKSVIVLFSEIYKNDSIIDKFNCEFKSIVSVLHSSMSQKKQLQEWQRISRGEAKIVIGTRSALFSPVKKLGLIIMDQEEEFTYKQEKSPKYHAKETARYLAKMRNIPFIASSGVPSIEAYYYADRENHLFELQAQNKMQAQIKIIDMREEGDQNVLSKELVLGIEESLQQKKQAVLFLNRRGYYPCLICRQCGEIIKCRNCSVSLIYHEHDKKLHCHRCGFLSDITSTCPNCLSSSIRFFGFGTQKIESEIKKKYPDAKILRIDKDSVSSKKYWDTIMEMFILAKADILIGTQMILKALMHKSVYMVGVVSADNSLYMPDFKAGENTFQMLAKICGFSGNYCVPENVFIQTYNPDHYAIQLIKDNNYKAFYEKENILRKENKFPPFARVVNITISSNVANISEETALGLFKKIKKISESIEILGPVQTAVAKVRGATRWQILIKGANLDIIKRDLKDIILSVSNKQVRISIDVDPIQI